MHRQSRTKKIALALGLVASHCIAFAQFTPYLSMTGVTWDDEVTFWLDGARIDGLGLTKNDQVNAKFRFRTADASFVLVDSKVILGAGVVYREQGFTSVDVSPSLVNYTVGTSEYPGDSSNRRFTATRANPFVAKLALKVGHVISHRVGSTNIDYSFEVVDNEGKVVSSFDGVASSGSVISGAYRITTPGNYSIRVFPQSSSANLSFDFALLNANNSQLRTLVDGSQINVRFATDVRDYYKATVQLAPGQRFSIPDPSDSNISMCLLDSYSRQKACVNGLPLSYKATESGTYYLFIYNIRGWSSSYFGTARVSQEALSGPMADRGRTFNSTTPRDSLANVGRPAQ